MAGSESQGVGGDVSRARPKRRSRYPVTSVWLLSFLGLIFGLLCGSRLSEGRSLDRDDDPCRLKPSLVWNPESVQDQRLSRVANLARDFEQVSALPLTGLSKDVEDFSNEFCCCCGKIGLADLVPRRLTLRPSDRSEQFRRMPIHVEQLQGGRQHDDTRARASFGRRRHLFATEGVRAHNVLPEDRSCGDLNSRGLG